MASGDLYQAIFKIKTQLAFKRSRVRPLGADPSEVPRQLHSFLL